MYILFIICFWIAVAILWRLNTMSNTYLEKRRDKRHVHGKVYMTDEYCCGLCGYKFQYISAEDRMVIWRKYRAAQDM